MPGEPVVGDLIYVTAAASPQFGGDRALILRILRVSDKPTYYGWCWLTGYVLDRYGNATNRREIFVLTSGLRRMWQVPPTHARVHRAWTSPRAGALV